MTRLHAYKQYIGMPGRSGWHITLSENPPGQETLTDAVYLGAIELAPERQPGSGDSATLKAEAEDDHARREVGKNDFQATMEEPLTIEVLDRIISNHESGIQATAVNVYRQFKALLLERDSLRAEVENLKGSNEMLEQDLINRMPPTFCPECRSCGESGCCSPDACKAIKCLYLDENKRSYREMAAALDRAEAERDALRQVLGRLLSAKDEKDENGETPRYRELKDGAWEAVRAVLSKPVTGEAGGQS